MVFVDNPACVGFSYSSNANLAQDCNSSDTKSADSNHRAVKQILAQLNYTRYAAVLLPLLISCAAPSPNSVPFFITGESWSGVYTPMMSALLSGDPATHAQFQGFAVGNPVMLCYGPSDPVDQKVGDTWVGTSALSLSLSLFFYTCGRRTTSTSSIGRATLAKVLFIRVLRTTQYFSHSFLTLRNV